MMSIVRAVIYIQLLHLIAGVSVDHCDKLGYYNYQCVFNVSSAKSQLSVQCDTISLQVKSLDSNNGNAFDEHNIPSQRRLWSMCIHRHEGLTIDRMGIYTSSWIGGIKQFPDYYFCDGFTSEWIYINNHRLNDTRKLGFSSTANCTTQCSTSLYWLKANNNAFEKVFNNSFCGLQGLTTLELNNNQIKELERDAFINLKSLESMEMINNSISVLPPGVFREQQNTLTRLLLSNNRLNSQSIMELKILKRLRGLYLSNNHIDILPNDFFKHMTQLEYLNLGNNLIQTLQGSLTNLINLKELFISANNISIILSEDLPNMVNLSWIDFSNNPITAVEHGVCLNCNKMTNVAIANALLTTVPKFISQSKKLEKLDISNNMIDHIDVGVFDTDNDLDSINLSFNQLTDITNVFTNCKVESLKLDHNRLTKLSFTDLPSNLYGLSITHNNIHTIDTSHGIVRRLWGSLEFLKLSHNHLNEIADGSFDNLTGLDVLILEHNNLRHISQNMFKNIISLTRLFLSHNKIRTIEPNAFPSQLRTLRLDNNRLLNFNVWQLDHLMNLTKLRLHGNTWSCDLIDRLEEWLLKKSRIVEDICQIVCEQPNGTLLRVSQSSHCPETTSINLDELNITNEINYANGVIYANVWAWLLSLCVCVMMCAN